MSLKIKLNTCKGQFLFFPNNQIFDSRKRTKQLSIKLSLTNAKAFLSSTLLEDIKGCSMGEIRVWLNGWIVVLRYLLFFGFCGPWFEHLKTTSYSNHSSCANVTLSIEFLMEHIKSAVLGKHEFHQGDESMIKAFCENVVQWGIWSKIQKQNFSIQMASIEFSCSNWDYHDKNLPFDYGKKRIWRSRQIKLLVFFSYFTTVSIMMQEPNVLISNKIIRWKNDLFDWDLAERSRICSHAEECVWISN